MAPEAAAEESANGDAAPGGEDAEAPLDTPAAEEPDAEPAGPESAEGSAVAPGETGDPDAAALGGDGAEGADEGAVASDAGEASAGEGGSDTAAADASRVGDAAAVESAVLDDAGVSAADVPAVAAEESEAEAASAMPSPTFVQKPTLLDELLDADDAVTDAELEQRMLMMHKQMPKCAAACAAAYVCASCAQCRCCAQHVLLLCFQMHVETCMPRNQTFQNEPIEFCDLNKTANFHHVGLLLVCQLGRDCGSRCTCDVPADIVGG